MTLHSKANQVAFWLAVVMSTGSFAEEVKFFEGSIDYWTEPPPKAATQSIPTAPLPAKKDGSSSPPAERSTFDWQRVMDPKNDDFFREGDYVPPAPFMEVARDPSDQNIGMWYAYIKRKNELATRLEQRLQDYGAKHGLEPAENRAPAVEAAASPRAEAIDPRRFRFRLYFDSTCPHCRRMMTTLTDLNERGFFVEAKQTDARPLAGHGLPFPISRAEDADVKRHGISSVPFLLVGDVSEKVVYKMTGFKTVGEIFNDLSGKQVRKP